MAKWEIEHDEAEREHSRKVKESRKALSMKVGW